MPTVFRILDELNVKVKQRLEASTVLTEINLRPSLEPHVHLRGPRDGRLSMTLQECSEAHAVVIDIGNNPDEEVTSLALVEKRDVEVQEHMPGGSTLRVYYAPLVGRGGDMNIMRDIRAQPRHERKAKCIKVFFEGVSNAKTSITDVEQIRFIIEDSTRGDGPPTPITWHAECLLDEGGELIPIRDREYHCVTKQIERALPFNKDAAHIIRHVSDYRTVEWALRMRDQGYKIYLELSMQYFLHTEDSIFMADDGSHAVLQCGCVYWPRPKDERSRRQFPRLIRRNFDWIMIGNDYAPHLEDMSRERGVKINSAGEAVGGLNFRPRDAKSLLIDFCVGMADLEPKWLEILENLLRHNAARVYDIAVPFDNEHYAVKEYRIPEYTYGRNPSGQEMREVRSRCFLANRIMRWQRIWTPAK